MRESDDFLEQPVATTRVDAGGASNRVLVAALAAVIAAVVWIGVSGRQAAPPTRVGEAFSAATPLGRDKFAVTSNIAQRPFLGLLDEKSPGEMSGTYRLTVPKPHTVARFELSQLWTIRGGPNYVPINAWEVPLGRVSANSPEPSVLLDVTVAAMPNLDGAPRPVRSGYSLVIRAERAQSFELVTFDLKMATR